MPCPDKRKYVFYVFTVLYVQHRVTFSLRPAAAYAKAHQYIVKVEVKLFFRDGKFQMILLIWVTYTSADKKNSRKKNIKTVVYNMPKIYFTLLRFNTVCICYHLYIFFAGDRNGIDSLTAFFSSGFKAEYNFAIKNTFHKAGEKFSKSAAFS